MFSKHSALPTIPIYALSLYLNSFSPFHSLFNFHSIQHGICLFILSLFTMFTLLTMFAMHCHFSSSQVCCLYLQCLHFIYPKYIKAVLKICIVYIGERKIETSTTWATVIRTRRPIHFKQPIPNILKKWPNSCNHQIAVALHDRTLAFDLNRA